MHLTMQPPLLQERRIGFFAEEVPVKPTALNAPPFLRWFYRFYRHSFVLKGNNVRNQHGAIRRSLSCAGFGLVLQAAINTLKCEQIRDC